jgi:hypothetical protein
VPEDDSDSIRRIEVAAAFRRCSGGSGDHQWCADHTFALVNALIVATAQYLLYALVVAAGLVWLTCPRSDKLMLAAESVVGPALVGIGIWVAGALHVDPRPFVHGRSSAALFAHASDNGFPPTTVQPGVCSLQSSSRTGGWSGWRSQGERY